MVITAANKAATSSSGAIVPRWLSAKQSSLLSGRGCDDETAPTTAGARITPFQKTVYTALCRVPDGSVTTYRLLAQFIHCGSSQAVGQALRRNPYAPVIPCHRVVASNLTLGGFEGQTDGCKIDQKRQLLQREGVLFDRDGRVEASCIFDFSSDETRD